MRSLLLLLLASLLTACTIGGPPKRFTRNEQATRPADAPRPLWSTPIDVPFVDIFHVLANDRLLVGAVSWNSDEAHFVQRELLLLDIATGTTLWRAKRPTVDHGAYTFVGIAEGKVVLQVSEAVTTRWLAYTLGDGKRAWDHTIDAPAIAQLDGAGHLVIATNRMVRAIALADGKQRWERRITLDAKRSVPTVASDEKNLCIVATEVACAELATGKELWRNPFADDTRVVRAAIVDGLLVVATDKTITTWSTASGGKRWSRAVRGEGLANLEIAGDTLYAVGLDGTATSARIQALRTATGDIRWTSEPLPPPRGPLAVTSDAIYLSTPSVVVWLDPRSGARKGRAPIPFSLYSAMRAPDAVLVDDTSVTVVTENGAAIYAKDALTLQAVAPLKGAETWGDARYLFKYQRHPNLIGGASVMLAYQQPTFNVGVAAHYRLAMNARATNDISTAISETKAAQHAERVAANLALVNAAVMGLASALIAMGHEQNLQDVTDSVLARYFTTAADVRLEGTPVGYALAGHHGALLIYDPTRKAQTRLEYSSEFMSGWQHIAVVTPDGGKIVGAHVSFGTDTRQTKLNEILARHHLRVESYDLASAAWQAAALPAENPLLIEIRGGRLHSLRERLAYRPCHISEALPPELNLAQVSEAAVMGNNAAILRELEENGYAMISSGALEMAVGMGWTESTREIEAVMKRFENDLNLGLANAFGKLEQARAVLDAGGSPNGRPASPTRSCYPVPLAESKTIAMTELLLAKGAAVNLCDSEGNTPLDKRIAAKDEPNIKMLRAHGAKTAAELGAASGR